MAKHKLFVFITLLIGAQEGYSQQDLTFHINTQFLSGKKILKVKRDYYDPYVWVLAQNNGVYRINSQTLVIDDYTAKFSAYGNMQFIDIAGRSQDTVFVAANSPDVIEYFGGAFRDIGKLRGLTDTVNSIAMGSPYEYFSPQALQIGTGHGLANYFLKPDSLSCDRYHSFVQGPVKIFTETYRTQMVTNDALDYNAPNYYYPVLFSNYMQPYAYDIRHMLQSANYLNTAFYVPVGVVNPSIFAGSFFWGNSTGLYQESLDFEGDDPTDFNHFLDNIQINKITDILGLTSFYGSYNPRISKDNLLVGTDNGLYFSSSLMAKFLYFDIAAVNLYHFDPLGNLRINDICVNATGTNLTNIASGCENGVWLATDNGVYLLSPDYGAYLSKSTIANALFINAPLTDSVTDQNICQGSSIIAQLNTQYVNSNTIQWEKDGKDIAGANRDSLKIKSAGEYYALLYDPCENVRIQTNHIKVTVTNSPVFTFNYPVHIQDCSNAGDTLKVDNDPQYHYRWFKDGVFTHDTTSVYIVSQSGKYNVEVSSCTNSWVPSKSVQVDLITLPIPLVTAGKGTYCAEDTALLTLNIPPDTGYTINWYRNDTLLAGYKNLQAIRQTKAGVYSVVLNSNYSACSQQSPPFQLTFIPAPVFSFNYPDKIQQCNNQSYTLSTDDNSLYQYRWYTNNVLNGGTQSSFTVTQSGKYKVEVSACTNSWVPSKEVEVDMITLPVPQVTADKPVYCAEDLATLSVNTPLDASYTINWYQDGNLIATDANLTSIKTTTGGNYTATVASNISACTQTSAPVNVAFTPAPVFTFNYPDQLQYCSGTPLTLTAAGSSAYQYRWYKDGILNNVTTASLTITQSGKYKVEVSSCPDSWVASKEVQVNFVQLATPVITTDKPAYCTGDNATLALSTPPDPSYTINWYKDGALLPAATNQNGITTTIAGSYTAAIVNNTANIDGTTCSQTSAAQAISFSPPPTVSIKQTVNTTLCAGQTVSLAANYDGGTVKWSTGETTDQITVTQSGHYSVTATSPAGCQADAGIDVSFLPDPVFSLKDTSICTYKQQIITLTGPPGFAAYNWNNGESSNPTFQVSQPQTVSLTVTDANGCEATQQVKVADQCPTVFIPNTFTPNGDGVNDTWVIEGLDESGTVKVYTRWGSEVYQSIGYSTPWSGVYAGKKLAPGVYYYIVTAKNGSQKFSGSLTIIY